MRLLISRRTFEDRYCGENWYSIWSHKPDSASSILAPATNMEKYISKGFDTLSELTSFLNERKILKSDIIYIGPGQNGGYMLLISR